ncbi:hypothetical protein HR45_02535 [Shewanella mangrovi]|uniref:Uncharacterized protein n=1 Tax=Shewanella mangrovi TaxID=1515746 RepID=A0A094LVN6_9GAMM|nr:hypothetical protein [Shewanella mangrovi]KFZ39283.1 hypothetical protein HR45_02535 [Shewanella mangrovi]
MKKYGVVVVIVLLVIIGYWMWSQSSASVVYIANTETSRELAPDSTSLKSSVAPVASETNLATVSSSKPILDSQRLSKLMASCDGSKIVHTLDEDEAAFEAQRDSYIDNMGKSDDALQQLAYFYLQKYATDQDKTQSLLALSEQYPDNALVAYDALSYCNKFTDRCSVTDVERLMKGHENDAAFWMQKASFLLQHKQEQQALAAMEHIISEPLYFNAWAEHLAAFQQAYVTAGAADGVGTMMSALGLAARPIEGYQPVSSYCMELEETNAAGLDMCLRAGQRMANSPSTMFVNSNGLSFQKRVYQLTNAEAGLAQVAEKRAEFDKIQREASLMELLIYLDRKRYSDWLDNIRNAGQLEGTRITTQQILLETQSPDFDPCVIDW